MAFTYDPKIEKKLLKKIVDAKALHTDYLGLEELGQGDLRWPYANILMAKEFIKAYDYWVAPTQRGIDFIEWKRRFCIYTIGILYKCFLFLGACAAIAMFFGSPEIYREFFQTILILMG